MRKFELVKGANTTYLPTRATKCSAGYDFNSAIDYLLQPGEIKIIPTNVKAHMLEDEFLQLSLRSSLGKAGLLMMNSPGIVDSDYYENPNNDGNIGFIIQNTAKRAYVISMGDKIGQGVFQKYYTVDNDIPVSDDRTGGFGSTGK